MNDQEVFLCAHFTFARAERPLTRIPGLWLPESKGPFRLGCSADFRSPVSITYDLHTKPRSYLRSPPELASGVLVRVLLSGVLVSGDLCRGLQYEGLHNHQYNFEVCLRYMIL